MGNHPFLDTGHALGRLSARQPCWPTGLSLAALLRGAAWGSQLDLLCWVSLVLTLLNLYICIMLISS